MRKNSGAGVSAARGLIVALGMIAVLATAAAGASGQTERKGWRDDFSGDKVSEKRWVVANGRAPGYIPGDHIGYYLPDRVSVGGGYVTLRLTQEAGAMDSDWGVISRGALLYTRKKHGYGTYQWRMRMSSTAPGPFDVGGPLSGSVSAGFVYVNNSQTEIDFEFSGHVPETLYVVNWLNPDPSRDPTEADSTFHTVYDPDISNLFRTYKFVWEPGRISFYVDGALMWVHTTDVPSAPAHFMITHWGTNSPYWGGYATVGFTRYFHIDWVSYTPSR